MSKKLKTMTAAEKREVRDARINSLRAQLANSHQKIKEAYRCIPKSGEYLFLKVFCGKTGFPDRIKLKCLDCSCWNKDEVANCTVRQCPLWEIRPYQKK